MEDVHSAGAGRARQRDLEGQDHDAWQTGGGALYVTGSYDPATNVTYWGAGNPAPRYDSAYRPGDNLFTESTVAFDAATGKMKWYFQYTPTTTTTMTPAARRSSSTARSAARTARSSCMPTATASNTRSTAATASSSRRPNMPTRSTWTKGIDAESGKPLDYDPSKDVQTYNNDWKGGADTIRQRLPGRPWRHQFLAARLQPEDASSSISPATKAAPTSRRIATAHVRGKFGGGGYVNNARITSASRWSIPCPAR